MIPPRRFVKGVWALLLALFISPVLAEERCATIATLGESELKAEPLPVIQVPLPLEAGATGVLDLRLRYLGGDAAELAEEEWSYPVCFRVPGSEQVQGLAIRKSPASDVQGVDVYEQVMRWPEYQIGDDVTVVPCADEAAGASVEPNRIEFEVRVCEKDLVEFNASDGPTLSIDEEHGKVVWTAVPGASGYELEWVHVDSLAQVPVSAFEYKRPVRIFIDENGYEPELIYPDGTLHFRVRAVSLNPDATPEQRRRWGVWSEVQLLDVASTDNLNWELRLDFSERGYQGRSITYFDGLVRDRQSITARPSQDNALISERHYDHEGRAALTVLPAPRAALDLTYAPGFNRIEVEAGIKPLDFDGRRPAALSPMHGAGRYFGDANENPHSHAPYIPDSEGYPFSTVAYERDRTGRPAMRGGVGKELQIDPSGGQFEQFVYGSSNELVLKGLFGSRIGAIHQYRRDIVFDPNGQATVSYSDSSDRPLAHGILNNAPATLEALPAGSSDSVTTENPAAVSLNADNQMDLHEGVSRSVSTVANAIVGSDYEFTYVFSGVDFTTQAGQPARSVCISCKYELEIGIDAPGGTRVALSDLTVKVGGVDLEAQELNEVCAYEDSNKLLKCNLPKDSSGLCQVENLIDSGPLYENQPEVIVAFKASFGTIGAYTITKTLYQTSVPPVVGMAWPGAEELLATMVSQNRDEADTSICGIGCESQCASVANEDPDVFDQCLDACGSVPARMASQACEASCAAIGDEVTDDGYGIIECLSSCEVLEEGVAGGGDVDALAIGQQQCEPLLPVWIEWFDPADVDPYDPEAQQCYGRCRELGLSNYYDLQFTLTNSYEEALAAGFLNPLGMTGIDGIPVVENGRDPYFFEIGCSGPGCPLYNEMEQSLQNYTDRFQTCPVGQRSLSLWEFVALPEIHPGHPDPVPLDAQWQLFRGIYLGLKRELEDRVMPQCVLSEPIFPTDQAIAGLAPADAAAFQFASQEDQYATAYCPYRAAQWVREIVQAPGCHIPGPGLPILEENLLQYCMNVAGVSNPLAQIYNVEENGFLNTIEEALPAGCSLSDLVTDPVFEMERICRTDCCSETDLNACGKLTADTVDQVLSATQEGERPSPFDMPYSWREECGSPQTIVVTGEHGFTLQLRDTENPSACSLLLVDDSGRVLDPGWVLDITYARHSTLPPPQLLGFTSELGLLSTQISAVAKYVDLEQNGAVVEVPVFLIWNCPFTTVSTAQVPCEGTPSSLFCNIEGDQVSPVGATNTLRNLSRLREDATRSFEARSFREMSPIERLRRISPTPAERERAERQQCKPFAAADACVLETLEFGIPEDGTAIVEVASCRWSDGLVGRGTCKYAFYDEAGELITAERVTRTIGEPVFVEDLPPGYNAPSTDLAFANLRLGLFERGGKFIWGYLFSDCSATREDCRDVPVGISLEFPRSLPDVTADCEDDVVSEAERQARLEWDRIQEEAEEALAEGVSNNCFAPGAFFEEFSYNTENHELHYSLQMFDQAGNLVETVPPLGVDTTHLDGSPGEPEHRMSSRFAYDGLGLTWKRTPDAGTTWMVRDAAGRVRFTQTSRQWDVQGEGTVDPEEEDDEEQGEEEEEQMQVRSSFIRYDAQGRIIATGVLKGFDLGGLEPGEEPSGLLRNRANNLSYPSLDGGDGEVSELVRTFYDSLLLPDGTVRPGLAACEAITPSNLRGRVVARQAEHELGPVTTCFSYDPHGYVTTVLQDLPILGSKRIDYNYDLLSGLVQAVHYQSGQPDALHTRFTYNADNQLITVETSRDLVIWDRDAHYLYYPHGPLARLELGHGNVQGIDYAWTLQGWPAAINGNFLTADGANDPGGDGQIDPSNPGASFARDAVSVSFGYFPGDYKPIGDNVSVAADVGWLSDPFNPSAFGRAGCAPGQTSPSPKHCGLYDGNLRHMVTSNLAFEDDVLGTAYTYDQLYRLTSTKTFQNFDRPNNRWPETAAGSGTYDVALSYDSNGNIQTLTRNAPDPETGVTRAIDTLDYVYEGEVNDAARINNRLLNVNDSAPATVGNDIPRRDQTASAFQYDPAGNLVRDDIAQLSEIEWNDQGRVRRVIAAVPSDAPEESPSDEHEEARASVDEIEFIYDSLSHRVVKLEKNEGEPVFSQFFVRDLSGVPLAHYRFASSEASWEPTEATLILHGARRLGTAVTALSDEYSVQTTNGADAQLGFISERIRGVKHFEISNNHETAIVVLSDRKVRIVQSGASSDQTQSYAPIALSGGDSYPFGMEIPNRKIDNANYKFGFKGYERDQLFSESQNYYNTFARWYNPKLATWMSVDPIETPQQSPYSAFSGNPIIYKDYRGLFNFTPNDAYNENYIYLRRMGVSHEEAHIIAQETRDAHAGMHRVVGEFIFDAFSDTAGDLFEVGSSVSRGDVSGAAIAGVAAIVPGLGARAFKKIKGRISDVFRGRPSKTKGASTPSLSQRKIVGDAWRAQRASQLRQNPGKYRYVTEEVEVFPMLGESRARKRILDILYQEKVNGKWIWKIIEAKKGATGRPTRQRILDEIIEEGGAEIRSPHVQSLPPGSSLPPTPTVEELVP